jgi:hypothetical protein
VVVRGGTLVWASQLVANADTVVGMKLLNDGGDDCIGEMKELRRKRGGKKPQSNTVVLPPQGPIWRGHNLMR